MRILGVSGSLRRASYNTALLRTFKELLPGKASMELGSIGDLPLYNADIDGDTKPEPVARFLEQLRTSDALLFATPEYNYGIPGPLKNAIDWASRPAFSSPMTGKPAGIISASLSPVGGARAQAALRHVLAGTLSPFFPYVDVLVGTVQQKFDDQGNLTDGKTLERLGRYAEAFVEWIDRQRNR